MARPKAAIQAASFDSLQQNVLADIFGVTKAAVTQWDCPRNPDKSYNLVNVIAWWRAKHEAELADLRDNAKSKDPEKRRKDRAQANLLELTFKERVAELIPRAEVTAILGEWANDLREAGKDLYRAHGPSAQSILTRRITKWQKEIESIESNPDK